MRSFIPRAGISLVLGLSLSLNLGLAGAQTKDKVPAKEADSSADQGVGRARQLHPLPQSVAGNSTVTLHCGRQYYGTLDLSNRSNVTVRTEGSCGKASISPGQPVKGWGRQKGTIWIAPVASPPDIVTFNDKPLALAHFPNKPWARGRSDSPDRIHAKLPSADLVGATVVYRPEEWMIETRAIAGVTRRSHRARTQAGRRFRSQARHRVLCGRQTVDARCSRRMGLARRLAVSVAARWPAARRPGMGRAARQRRQCRP
jgi:hypothetical protein